MRKKIIIVFIIFALAITAIVLIAEFIQYKSIKLTLEQSGYTVEIRNEASSNTISKLSSSTTVRLKPGEYYYTTVGEKFNSERTYFTVIDNTEIIIDPNYSEQYLSTLGETETEKIRTLLNKSYPQIKDKYTLDEPRLYKQGDWAGGRIIQTVDRRQSPDIYRYIVQKTGNEWKIIAPPNLTLSKFTYPDIPLDVLRSVNSTR